jgi:hypothetical protein
MSHFDFAPLPAAKTEGKFRDFLTKLDANFEALNISRPATASPTRRQSIPP